VLRSQFKDHRFQPSQLSAPPDRPISIRVKNLDAAPMEFESVSLRVEKVIGPGYEFFDDFHPETRGILVVE
jgi:hypothetical protein